MGWLSAWYGFSFGRTYRPVPDSIPSAEVLDLRSGVVDLRVGVIEMRFRLVEIRLFVFPIGFGVVDLGFGIVGFIQIRDRFCKLVINKHVCVTRPTQQSSYYQFEACITSPFVNILKFSTGLTIALQ